MTRTAYHSWNSSKNNFLLLRFQKNETKHQSYVIFDEKIEETETSNYQEILADEKKWHERKIRKNLDNLLFESDFCAFLCLDENLVLSNHEITKHLDTLLRVSELLWRLEIEYNSWCDCNKSDEKVMIECNNVKCNIEWYHKSCVKLQDNYTANFWLCTRCQTYEKEDAEYDRISDLKVNYNKVALTSSERVHLIRFVCHIIIQWEDNILSSKQDIFKLFKTVFMKCEKRYFWLNRNKLKKITKLILLLTKEAKEEREKEREEKEEEEKKYITFFSSSTLWDQIRWLIYCILLKMRYVCTYIWTYVCSYIYLDD